MPGVYVDSLTTVYGCDSVIFTQLTVWPTYLDTLFVQACPGDAVFAAGAYQTVTGDYTDVYPTVHGCDSTIITSLYGPWLALAS